MGSAETLLTIINDILDFSKIEAGRIELEPLPIDLMTLAEDVAALMSLRAREKGLELITRIMPGTHCHLIGDPTRIHQIISNLLGNAIKFTEAGHVLLHIEDESGHPHIPGQACIRVSVTDTGIGIPEDIQPRLFQKFMQADASTTRKFGGTGLGLAICKQLVEMMGGEISVKSQPGKGSTFSFTMTLPTFSHEAKKTKGADVLKGLRILIVDDVEHNVFLLKERLQEKGAICGTSCSAKEALEALSAAVNQNAPFDMAIIDYVMPEMDGIALAKKIRADNRFQDVDLVAISSAFGRVKTSQFKKVGYAAFLPKPFRIREVVEALTLIRNAKAHGDNVIFITENNLNTLRGTSTETGKVTFKSPEVLLAEDNRVNQGFAIEVLESAGCKVTLAVNGLEAVEISGKKHFDLILMDCEMPEMSGFDATRAIREREKLHAAKPTPIIALTANAMQGDRERCQKAGMDDYLTKPMRKNHLLRVMAKIIPGHVTSKTQVSDDFCGMKILLVEDNRINRMMAEEILSEMGFIITVAENGEKAVEAVKKQDFDVILMDCQMPVMDGYEATRQICQLCTQGKIRHTPIIALTANALKGDREKCLDAGMDDYMTKPVHKQNLKTMLGKWLKDKKTSGS